MSDGYRTQSPDTSYEAEQIQIARLREMTMGERFELLRSVILLSDRLARTGIRMRHPDASEDEVAMRSVALRLDASVIREAHGWDPDSVGQ